MLLRRRWQQTQEAEAKPETKEDVAVSKNATDEEKPKRKPVKK